MTDNADYIGDEAQIGGGFGGMKPLAQHGTVTISQGVLTLFDSNGAAIASAPLEAVEVKQIKITRGLSVSVVMDGTKYSLSVGWGRRLNVNEAGGRAQQADAKEGTQGFVEAFEQLSGKRVS